MRLILSGCATCLALCNAPISGQDEQAGGAQKTREQGSRVSQEDRQFWAFGPLRKITPPQPRDASWVRNPIDRFIRAAQEHNGVSPSSAGTPQSLFRRANRVPPRRRFVRDYREWTSAAHRCPEKCVVGNR